MEMVSSSASNEDNELPDEPLPKKPYVITVSYFFTFGRKARGSYEPMKIHNCHNSVVKSYLAV